MEIATIPAKDLRHTRAAQDWIAEGRLKVCPYRPVST
jgi:hypothetical protein